MKTFTLLKKISIVTTVAIGIPIVSLADDAPLSHIAEPSVYKVLEENDQFRVVLATWKPGQWDAFHSHPSNVVFRITDCKNRVYRSDGSIAREGKVKAGSVKLQQPVKSHSFKNVSDKECQTLIIEKK